MSLERNSEWPASASIDSTHRTLPMTDMYTNISMVAKTVGPGASPPSTIAGSTRDTVLNETAFDVSEIREIVNPVGPEARHTRAHIGGMSCDKLVSLLNEIEVRDDVLFGMLMYWPSVGPMLSVRQLRSHRNNLICQALENGFIKYNLFPESCCKVHGSPLTMIL